MPTDLPDYTRMMAVNVEITEPEVGPVNVARYVVAPADLTDGDRAPLLSDIKGRAIIKVIQDEAGDLQVTVTPAADAEFTVVQDTAEDLQAAVRPRPKGGILETGVETTGAGYARVAYVTVTDGKSFQLSKIVVSAELATWIEYRWDDAVISCERLMDEKTILLEHFPWDYEDMEGDGSKAFEVWARYYEDPGQVNVEIVGEEV